MANKHERSTTRKFLTDEQIQYLQAHQVMSVAQLHQLARQIKLLRRIRERTKLALSQKPIGFRSSNIQPSWGAEMGLSNLEGIQGAEPGKSRQTAKKPRGIKQPKQPASKSKKRKKVEEEEKEEEEELLDSDMTEEDEDMNFKGTAAAARERKLRPRKQVSFNLDQMAASLEASDAAAEGSETEDDEVMSKKGSRGSKTRSRGGSNAVLDEEGDHPAQLIDMQPVRVEWDAEDAICGVCGDDEQADGNEIVLCDGVGCDVAVHQQCYGMTRVPRGKWFCDACTDKLDLSKPNCVCCPVLGGVLRKVKVFGGTKVAQRHHNKRPYVHLACALWTPEIIITEPDAMRAPSLEGLRQHRVDLVCAICKQGGGAVIQCSFGVCTRAFHVLCGRHVKAAAAFRHSDGHPLAFCVEHSKERYQRTRDKLIAGDDAASPDSRNTGVEAEAPAGPVEPNEYEILRQQNIERNRQMLASL